MGALPYLLAEDVNHLVDWPSLVEALRQGHRRGRADIDDLLFKRGDNALLSRAAWIDELGIAVKSVTVFPDNVRLSPPLPSVNGVVTLFDNQTGQPRALLDGNLVTYWKTAGDSMLGAQLLARPESETLLVVGAGAVARSLVSAYRSMFPGLSKVSFWNRTRDKAEVLASQLTHPGCPVGVADDLALAVAEADIVATATMSCEPVLRGDWVQPGTHVDLIGAYRPDMREADDALLLKSELFVDARETTLQDIGELLIPLRQGVIDKDWVRGDLYDLCNGAPGRGDNQSITVFKNGGGAHLDLMTATYLLEMYEQSRLA